MTTRHPEPAASFASVPLLVRKFPHGRSFWRVHRKKHGPFHFGKTSSNRFDAPAGQFGVLYVGADAHCAFIETFGHATGTNAVSEAELRGRDLTIVTSSRELRLADLRGAGLARIRADAALTSGSDYGLTMRWALAIHEHPKSVDGIAYLARHDPARTSVALFDRVAPVLTAKTMGCFLDAANVNLLDEILETYKFALTP